MYTFIITQQNPEPPGSEVKSSTPKARDARPGVLQSCKNISPSITYFRIVKAICSRLTDKLWLILLLLTITLLYVTLNCGISQDISADISDTEHVLST